MTDHVAIHGTNDPHRRRRRSPYARFGRLGVGLVTGALALYGLTAVATATTSTKPYSLAVTIFHNGTQEQSVAAGSTNQYSFAIKDLAPTQPIQSAEIVPPNGFTINAASISVPAGATATLAQGSGNCPLDQVSPAPSPVTCLVVNNLTITSGMTETISFSAATSCAAAPSDTFGLQVQQANQFNGKPGNQSGPLTDPAALNVSVTGSCTLKFVTEPADANPGATISTSSYNPSAGPIKVEALDGNSNPVSNVDVTLGIASASPDPGKNAQLFWGTAAPMTQTDGSGIASFGPVGSPPLGLNIAQPGEYVLQATNPGFPTAYSTASGFFIGNGAVCTTTCSASASDPKNGQNDNLSATTTTTGTITLIVGLDSPFCSTSDGLSHAPDVTTTSATNLTAPVGTLGKHLQITFPSKLGPGHFEVCFQQDGGNPVVLGACGNLQQPVTPPCLISPISKDNTTGLINEDILAPEGDGNHWW